MLGLRCILFIFLVVSIFQGSLAIEVSFSAEDGGESVGISDEYDVSTGISVSEESEAKFGNVEMINSREVNGDGDVNMAQTYSGSGGYVGNNYVFAQDATSTISTSAILTPATLNAKLSGNIIGQSGYLGLNLISNGNSAWTSASMNGGVLNTNMAAWTGSASVFQITDINAESGRAGSWAGMLPWDGRQTRASTNVWVQNGILHSVQSAKNDGTASAFQISDINAELGGANSDAGQLQEDASTNYATTFTQINNGRLKTEHIATDDGTASVSQESEMTGERGYADSRAGYFVEYEETMGPVFALAVGSEAQLSNGKMSILQTAKDGKSTITSQDARFIAESGMAYSNLRDADGNYATTYSSMDQGILTTRQIAEIDDKARVSQVSTVNGKGGYTTSSAQDANGKNIYTSSNMGNGWLTTMQAAEIDDKATASQNSEVNAERGSSESYAKDGKGNSASTSNHMEYGTLTTEHNAIIDDSVSASQNSDLNADSGYAASSAKNAKGDESRTELGMNYQSDLARKGALSTDQTSEADESKAIVSQISEVNAAWSSASSYAGRWNEGNYAETSLNMKNGNLKTDQTAQKDGISAIASQTSDINAEEGSASSYAGHWRWNDEYQARTTLDIKNGNLKTDQIAIQDSSSVAAAQTSEATADEGSANSYAGHWDNVLRASTHLDMENGNFKTDQTVRLDDISAMASQTSKVTADEGHASSYARDSIGNNADTSSNIWKGVLTTLQTAESADKVAVSQYSDINGDQGNTNSYAQDAEGYNSHSDRNKVCTSSSIDRGTLSTHHLAEVISGKATVSQNLEMNAEWGNAFAWARDYSQSSADAGCNIRKGSLLATTLNAEISMDNPKASGETYIILTEATGQGWANAGAYPWSWPSVPSKSVSKYVDYGSILHAAMWSEINAGVPSADVVVL